MDKIKTYLMIGIFVLGVVLLVFLLNRKAEISKQSKTEEETVTQQEYKMLEEKYNKEIQKNIDTQKKITELFDENGKLKSRTTETSVLDLSKINSSYESLNLVISSLQAKIKSLESIKYAVYPIEIAVGGKIDIVPFKVKLLTHADIDYFWINNNMGSGASYDWDENKIKTRWLSVRF